MNIPYCKVSICTPTFNRRPFIPLLINCIEHQTYPLLHVEWIIIDDGTDKIEDLIKFKNVYNKPTVKYYKYDNKMTLGKKRNLMHEKCDGDIIIYMDDDDYYPPERISHAVETLQNNPSFLCAGSSKMYMYFNHINKIYIMGPYANNHATAATFAFKRELLFHTKYNETNSISEEKEFLKNHTIPVLQLDSLKTIVVFSHLHNSIDKKILLENEQLNPTVHQTNLTLNTIITNKFAILFIKSINNKLKSYNIGNLKYKPDVELQVVDKYKNKNTHNIKLIQNAIYNEIINRNNNKK